MEVVARPLVQSGWGKNEALQSAWFGPAPLILSHQAEVYGRPASETQLLFQIASHPQYSLSQKNPAAGNSVPWQA